MANSAEGKRLALCDLCDKNKPAKYCQTCNGSLCTQCVEDHSKTRIFKGHTVTDLPAHDITQSRFKSGEAESGLSKCPKHLAKELDSFCKTCSCFICTDCKSSHGGHTIQSAKDDIQLYHSMCRKHIQGLLDGVHELEEYKHLIDKVFYAYDEATGVVDEWETDLLDHVRDKATKLRAELKSEKDKWVNLLENLKKEANTIQENADKEINNLNEMRKSQDCEILSHKLKETQHILAELAIFKQKNKTKPEVPQTKQLLPNSSVIPKAKNDIDTVFTKSSAVNAHLELSSLTIGVKNANKHDSLRLQHDIPIPKPNSSDGYRICKDKINKSIILHGISFSSGNSDIRRLDIEKFIIEKPVQKCSVDIWNMATLGNDTYIAKNNKANELHLLDSNFSTLSILKPRNEVKAVCDFNTGQFITLERVKLNKSTVNHIKIDKGKMHYDMSVEIEGSPRYIGLHPDGNQTYSCSEDECIKVNQNKEIIYSPIKEFLHFPKSVMVDTQYVYMATQNGKIHAIANHSNQENFKLKCILDTKSNIRDTVLVDEKVVVSTNDNRILIYY